LSGTVKPPLKVYDGSVNYQFKSGNVDILTIPNDELRRNIRWKEISYVMQGYERS